VFVLDHLYMSLFSTCGWILRLGVTITLLVSIHLFLPSGRVSRFHSAPPLAGARGRGARPRIQRTIQPARAAPLHHCDDRRPGKGMPRSCERREADHGPTRRLGTVYGPIATARWGSAFWHTLAWAVFGAAYVGAVVFVASGLGAEPVACCSPSRRAHGSRLHRRDGRRDRIPARNLDGRVDQACVAGRLRGLAACVGRPPGAGSNSQRHPLRARLLQLPGNDSPRSGRRQPGSSRGRGGRSRGRERSR
jgi:hypothetical protein